MAQAIGLGCSRFARRYSGNRVCFLFLRVLRCFSSPGLPPTTLWIQVAVPALQAGGLPHSEISGSTLTYSSPKHIGVRPVLHRLLAPRHPPCALSSLTYLRLLLQHIAMPLGISPVICNLTESVRRSFQASSLPSLLYSISNFQGAFVCGHHSFVATRNNISRLLNENNTFLNKFINQLIPDRAN
jgi:hypothetical protein